VTTSERLGWGDDDGGHGAFRAAGEALEPSAVVELGVLLVDEALVVDLHVVDADNWVWDWGVGGDLPSPGDVSASVPDVESLGGYFRLAETLT
jgi:hypothetical protein